MGLLSTFVEQALSFPLTNSGSNGGGIIARIPLTHLAGTGRGNLVNYSTCLRRLTRVLASPIHLGDKRKKQLQGGGGQSGAEEGQGIVGPAICAAGVPKAEMACGVDPGTSVLEGSNVMANWADIGGAVGKGGGTRLGRLRTS